jgi:hypothetical protein
MDRQEMKKALTAQVIESRFYNLRASLYDLVDDNPQVAIDAVRALPPDDILDAPLIDGLKAGILVDAGIEGHNKRASKRVLPFFNNCSKMILSGATSYTVWLTGSRG